MSFVVSLAFVAALVPPRQETPDAQRGAAPVGPTTKPGTRPDYRSRHAILFGIDHYRAHGYPALEYAAGDAEAVAKLLIERYGFAPDRVRLCVDEQATKSAMERALDDWACDKKAIDPDDLLVVYFAGHGETQDLGKLGARGFLVPADGERDADGHPRWSTLLSMSFLEETSPAIPAKHVLYVLDCCFGGLAVRGGPPPVAAGLTSRAREVLTAGTKEQPVLDGGGGHHSVFAGALLDALSGGDDVVTFGGLFNSVSRRVETATDHRQTPLQHHFRDHEGGSVALFPPGTRPPVNSAAEQLAALQRTAEEQMKEIGRLSDIIIVRDLEATSARLWPKHPRTVPELRAWLKKAREVRERLPQHEESLLRVRQEAYLSQVVAGRIAEREEREPDWQEVDPLLRLRYETTRELVDHVRGLDARIADVQARLDDASTVAKRSVGDFRKEWDDAIAAIAGAPAYGGLAITPQIGLVPLGPDPQSGLQEFWQVQSGERPVRDESSGPWKITAESGIVLVLLPGGTFWMGSQRDDPTARNFDPHDDELHPPTSHVVAPLFVSKFEMTRGQWQRIAGKQPLVSPLLASFLGADAPIHPVTYVSWVDSQAALACIALRLPSEIEWEYAARAGTTTPWWCGETKESIFARKAGNVLDESMRPFSGTVTPTSPETWNDGFPIDAPVGRFAANAFGLHDVIGNVWEWCADRVDSTSDAADAAVGDAAVAHVIRGGSFLFDASAARSSHFDQGAAGLQGASLGQRPARSLEQGE